MRAGMVAQPGDYRWSSYRAHAQGVFDPLLRDHEVYLELGAEPVERHRCYRDLFRNELTETLLHEIRSAVNHCHVLGGRHFQAQVEAMLGRKVGTGRPGRPRTEQPLPGSDGGQLELLTKKY